MNFPIDVAASLSPSVSLSFPLSLSPSLSHALSQHISGSCHCQQLHSDTYCYVPLRTLPFSGCQMQLSMATASCCSACRCIAVATQQCGHEIHVDTYVSTQSARVRTAHAQY